MNPSPRSACRAIALLAVAAGAPALASDNAAADVNRLHNQYKEVIVQVTSPGDHATIAAQPDGVITVNGSACSGDMVATVSNTDGIFASDSSGGKTTLEIDASKAVFAPGYTDTGLGSEIGFHIGVAAGDTVIVDGHQAGASIVAGMGGINLNANGEPFGEDTDVVFSSAAKLIVDGGPAADWISAAGGAGTGAAWSGVLEINGGGGDDDLRAGEPSQQFGHLLVGDAGDDILAGGSNGDRFEGGPGDDTITGGAAGFDAAEYRHAPAGVRVDLGLTGPQDTLAAGRDTIAGVEALAGPDHDNVLQVGAAGSLVYAGPGDDVLNGRDGVDVLHGEQGADTLRNGAGDGSLDGGDGRDVIAYDDRPGPVTVDLGTTGTTQNPDGSGFQNLGGIEGVIGSPFADRLSGSPGPDTIDGRDASPDSVSCGAGAESLAVDALDLLAADCAPAPAGGGPVPGTTQVDTAAPVLAVTVPRQSLRSVCARGLRAQLSCSAACRARGRLAITRRLGLSRRAARRAGRLPAVDLAAGGTVTARARLSRGARRALRGVARVKLVLRAGATGVTGLEGAPVRRPVRLRAG